MLSPNFQTRAVNFIVASVQEIPRVGDHAGNRRSGHRRRRAHVDARARVAHAAFEVARGRGDAGLARTEHTHVSAAARAIRPT